MFIETYNNNGIPCLRLVEGIRVIDDRGKPSIRKKSYCTSGRFPASMTESQIS